MFKAVCVYEVQIAKFPPAMKERSFPPCNERERERAPRRGWAPRSGGGSRGAAPPWYVRLYFWAMQPGQFLIIPTKKSKLWAKFQR
jgi:hypothetical protein